MNIFAEVFDHWDKYTSTTAKSINVHIGGLFSPISGTYSHDYMSVKSHQVMDHSKTTQVKVQHLLYKVQLQDDRQLHPDFKNRVFEIAAHLQNNNTELVHS